ncbi:hypothetical protein HPB50_004093 [Hyalomma asiaticum]|uniref:Uncharacterized protein n=1 Tax=Hyalomma asiaticum TaxID=266040 RepID=A0ACB7TC25_HYAAI|nr:hypothetical protein HPB50_004093 [Hyalomma asiaticum]
MATCSATPMDLVLTEAALTVRPLMSATAATKLFGPERVVIASTQALVAVKGATPLEVVASGPSAASSASRRAT